MNHTSLNVTHTNRYQQHQMKKYHEDKVTKIYTASLAFISSHHHRFARNLIFSPSEFQKPCNEAREESDIVCMCIVTLNKCMTMKNSSVRILSHFFAFFSVWIHLFIEKQRENVSKRPKESEWFVWFACIAFNVDSYIHGLLKLFQLMVQLNG